MRLTAGGPDIAAVKGLTRTVATFRFVISTRFCKVPCRTLQQRPRPSLNKHHRHAGWLLTMNRLVSVQDPAGSMKNFTSVRQHIESEPDIFLHRNTQITCMHRNGRREPHHYGQCSQHNTTTVKKVSIKVLFYVPLSKVLSERIFSPHIIH